MALSTLQRLKLIAPEFGSKPDSELEDYIELAAEEVSAGVFGDMYQSAVANLAAHFLTNAASDGHASGPLTSERAGEVSRSYGFSANRDGQLDTTTYGAEFKRIRNSRPGVHALTSHPKFNDLL
jgi:hypothetical protein